ncbi:Acidic cytochrome c3 [Desulfosarcina cetonica]|uniref:acidic tetraheme cytochrome c3 TmcA n=1 Tax=Desulfosarcina cetonica TaxID=90730 RepID=UPI0006CF9938|nr:cytochrome c3 family protein [Desulfosarcina cetonica]VTR68708.1 Acidic cytochrome c3 [Desulfosarcina cetonica]
MKTIALVALSLIIGTVLAISPVWSQDEMTVVDNTDFPNAQRPPSVFVHDRHNENAGIDDCAVCHHVYDEGQLLEDESSEDQRCVDCHYLERMGDQPGLMEAFHANCKGCHEQEGNGPILCGECHVR